MGITKVALERHRFHRDMVTFVSARAAFRSFLQALSFQPDDEVLLPAYIGWSAREGSGVFDPVRELGLRYHFYRVTERLNIDLDHLERCLQRGRVKAVVVIHYFGYVDPGYAQAVDLARLYGAAVLEDEAHALYSDLVGGSCGRLGDAAIFSLHKMLPVPTGGMLVLNPGGKLDRTSVSSDSCRLENPWSYDLRSIANRRIENARLLNELLTPLAPEVEPLWGLPEAGVVPQTFPVLVHGVSRDRLYHLMNDAGFGAVSLYHTMVDAISHDEYPVSYWLAKRVFNLPVHQDATAEDLRAMVDCLISCLDQVRNAD